MNFNFNFKDMLWAEDESIRYVTNAHDLQHMENSGIKRSSRFGNLVIRRCFASCTPSSMPDAKGDVRLWMRINNKTGGRNDR
jgi:hypothetical protein